jgi:uncharacterized protein YndB with AHSA1/START domain
MAQETSTPLQKTVFVTRILDLPLNSTWKAWTDSESFKKWWGPREYTCPTCSIDFRVGGKYLACMKAHDGREFWSTGVFKEIVPLHKIVYTDSFSDSKGNVVPASDYKMPGNWPLELIVTLTLEEVGGQTKLALQQVGIPEEIYNDCIEGWQQSFDKLESNLK